VVEAGRRKRLTNHHDEPEYFLFIIVRHEFWFAMGRDLKGT
jgi:hypothetical protein